ncbi:MAG: hypothetical protein M1838_005107 [Thelocarpon superellum]|nr:MAG: hypothetical protein M1838_005107 [Thelocarpon superellum]
MSGEPVSVTWTAQLSLSASTPPDHTLPGDKILLPASALEQLLSAATLVATEQEVAGSSTSTFDPFNPYSYAAEQHVRAQSRVRQPQLPHPLTFRLVNPHNGHVVYAGVREFSAHDGEVVLSSFLQQALGFADPVAEHDSGNRPGSAAPVVDETSVDRPKVTVHARQLPKGTYVRLRPLEAGYDIADWKSLLEQHLRANFTTLTNGEILTVPGGRGSDRHRELFRLLIDKVEPEGEGVCVVDTDVEVDIEALNEEQARETLKRQLEKSQRANEGGQSGGALTLDEGQRGQVMPGECVDYQITTWDRQMGIEIELGDVVDDEVDLFVSPLSARQRATPRDDEHVFGDMSSQYPKRIRLQPTNVELEGAEAIWVSVYGYQAPEHEADSSSSKPRGFHIRATSLDPASAAEAMDTAEDVHPSDESQCKNCQQWVPSRTMMLHETFCFRNNVLCPQCFNVFQKSSPEWQQHWHCPLDSAYGNSSSSHSKHDLVTHTPHECPGCSFQVPDLPTLATHRTTLCPAKLILCRFCHLIVPQEGDPAHPDPAAILSGLTPHELADGARTTDCHLCNRHIRLREMDAHLRHHALERRARPTPAICHNVNCGRTIAGPSPKPGPPSTMTTASNDLGLCGICFGPLYVSMYDPEGKALRRRVERRYLTQLRSGCGKAWCQNEYCRTGRANRATPGSSAEGEEMDVKTALALIKPIMSPAGTSSPTTTTTTASTPTTTMPHSLHFCVDEASQHRRILAEMISDEAGEQAGEQGGRNGKGEGLGRGRGKYSLEWSIAALEASAVSGDLQRARDWLGNWAPERD